MKPTAHHPLKEILTQQGISRLKSGHPWLYRTQIQESFRQPGRAGVIAVGESWFMFSPQSEIRLRRLGPFSGVSPGQGFEFIGDADAFRAKFQAPLTAHFKNLFARKKALVGGESCFRWVFSESDLIPGLVVDVFENEVVVAIQAAPLEAFWPVFKESLRAAFEATGAGPANILELRNMPVRKKEGLEVVEVPRNENQESGKWIRWNGLEWWMNPGGPQKTGAYLDQKENHSAAARWARRLGALEAWDLCCFEGGFALHLANAGLNVWAVDQSATALATTRKNAERNKIPADRLRTLEGNVFDELRLKHQNKERTDLIVLDPPSFVRSRADKLGALRGLKELNLRAFHSLKPGGMLVTCTCSHHIDARDLEEVLLEAAHDGRRSFKILETRGPSPDHAPLASFPESTYLQALFLELL